MAEICEKGVFSELGAVRTNSSARDQVKAAAPAGRRIVALDGLRGVAAIMVLLHHALLMLPVFADYEWYSRVPAHLSFARFLLLRTPLRLVWAGQERAIMFFVLRVSCFACRGLPESRSRMGVSYWDTSAAFILPILPRLHWRLSRAFLSAAMCCQRPANYFNQLGWARYPDAGTLPSILLVLTNHHSDYINEAVWSLTWEVRIALLFPLLMLPILRWRNRGAAQVYVFLLLLGQAGRHLLSAHPISARCWGMAAATPAVSYLARPSR